MKLTEKILGILTQDSRTTPAKIATMLGVSEDAVKKEIARLEKDGVILKYGLIINENKLEQEMVEALILVKVAPEHSTGFDAIASEIKQLDEVVSVNLMSGAYDLAVVVKGKTLKEVAGFVSQRLSVMDKVTSISTHFMLKKYKTDGTTIDVSEPKRLAVQA
ncbi:MAG: Lrp/AsnC family transcriptional regulator [Firmicutes bacterium]|nr:Lrp/AsnC family transcriptional regulator [Bacillota bacterium]